MFTYLKALPENARQRRQSLADADSWIAYTETLPKIALVFFLGVLPFLISETPFPDWSTFLWWVKGLTPIWLGVIALLYFSVGLKLAPAQLSGATIEAIAQANNEQELVSIPQSFETPCPFPAHTIEWEDRLVRAGTRTFWQQIHRRMPNLPQRQFPTRLFIPPSSSQDASA